MDDFKRVARRRHPAELKTRVLSECAVAGASIAKVALAHGLNANLVHKWRRHAVSRDVATVPVREAGSFIPMTMAPTAAPASADIRIELRRGTTAVNVSWPASAASDCAAWLRELLE